MQQLWLLLFCCSLSLGQRLAQKWLDPRRGPEELTRYEGEFRHGPYTLDTRDPSEELLRQRGLAPNDQERYGYLLSDQQGPSEQGHWKRPEERIPQDPLEGYGGPRRLEEVVQAEQLNRSFRQRSRTLFSCSSR
ncbi:hypothetical protein L596_013128 [Steinernema carpocapsae]|uniref:Uncharacterized protein n=1 Tax=Steinernema carpocapsae TaxID=34508 RepID=A0A4U5NZW8_STECR|nr:hypothetical protein L596_013128 [Steinernema carpocapsae]